ncbi:MAG: T9SS type A sorting domain-containing protein [Bacteroidales bacterium]|nr:T9SS type A sorting domain-containing protein [Bacteroidales bacterium]
MSNQLLKNNHQDFLTAKTVFSVRNVFCCTKDQPVDQSIYIKKVITGFILFLLLIAFNVQAANRYSVATGNWNSSGTWSATSGGSSGASAPVAGDNVFIEGGKTVTISANANCANLTIASGSALNIGGFNTNFTGTSEIRGTLTVTSSSGSKAFSQVIITGGTWTSNAAETYTITKLTLSGSTIGGSSTGVFNIAASGLEITESTNNTINRSTITVTGPTIVDGSLFFGDANGTKTFTGLVTNNGTWSNTANSSITFRGGFINNGSFVSGNGTYTLSTNSQSIGGSSPIVFDGIVAITGTITITNSNDVTISGNLTGSVTGSTWTNAANSTLRAGNAVLASGTLNATASGNTVIYSRSGTQTVKATSYYNLTLSGTSAKTTTSITVNNILKMEGTATASAVPAYGTNAGLHYNRTTDQNAGVEWAATFSGTGGIVISNTGAVTLNTAKTIHTNLTIENSAILNTVNYAIDLTGNFSNSGTFNSGSGTVNFTGSAQQYVYGSSLTTFNNVTLNNNAGLTLGASDNTGINGILTFTSGKITTGNNILIIGVNATVSGAGPSDYVSGNLRKVIATATSSFIFSVGDATTFAPVELIFTGTTNSGGNITVCATSGDHPEITASSFDPALTVNRYWSLINNGVTGITSYNAIFNFSAGDIDAGANFDSFVVGNYTNNWTYPITGNKTATSTEASGLTGFGDFQIGQCESPSQPSIISGNAATCSGVTGLVYSVINTPGISYNWAVPSGWEITSGQSTNIIAVTVGTESGSVTVTPFNSCGSGIARTLDVVVSLSPVVTADATLSEICTGQSVVLTASASPATLPAILLNENFNAATNSWTKINNSTGGTPASAAWTLRPNGYNISSTTFNSNDNSQFYMSNSDATGSAGITSTILQSPEISTIGYSSLSLSFWHHYRYYNGSESGKVEVSVNGTDWNQIAIYTGNQGSSNGFVNINLSLDGYTGHGTFFVRFKYDATYDWWWVIDNVSITGTPVNFEYLYRWEGSPSGTAGLPAGAGTLSQGNISIEASPTATTLYTAYAQNTTGCIGSAVAGVTVNSQLPVSVGVAASENPICPGTLVSFTATPVNGGDNPYYQWKLNGINVGINSPTYSSSDLANGDQVFCEMTSVISCTTGNPAVSNTITMVVEQQALVSVSIVASENPVCTGGSVTFTASPVNGGATPLYQWKYNGSDVGTNNSAYTASSVSNGDQVICILTSSLTCSSGNPATSNTIIMAIAERVNNNFLELSSGVHGTVCGTAVENANATVTAPAGTYISHIKFASYGTPNGSCGTFTYGGCNAATSFQVAENYLLGKNSSVIPATNGVFGDPCVGTVKRLYIQAYYAEPICAGSSPGEISGTLPTGGSGTFTYLWESSTTGASAGFATATGISNQQNYTPGDLTQTTWFRRTVYSAGCSYTSRVLQINVNGINTWTGNINSDWNNSSNWSCSIPGLTSDITIGSGYANYPVLNSGPAGQIRNLIIEPGASVTVNGNTLEIAGTITSSGTFTAGNGSIEMLGNTAQRIPAGIFTDNRVKNLTINNTQGVSLEGTLNLTGILIAQNGNFSTNDHLTLISSATQTALIDGSGNGEVLGNVTMQCYLTSGFGYKYVSSPFQNATVGGFSGGIDLNATFPSFYRYDENRDASGWLSYSDPAGALLPMTGYTANAGTSTDPKILSLSGTVNNGAMDQQALYNHDKTYTKGFNLMGNPYPSPIDWDASVGWTLNNVDDAIYYYDSGTTDQYTGTYSSYINGISSNGVAGNIIASMQSFFVHVSDGAYPVNGSFGMDNRVRVNTLTPAFHKSTEDYYRPVIYVSAGFDEPGLPKDPLVIYFEGNATPGFDKDMDALKLNNTDPNVPTVYVLSDDGRRLSIGAWPSIEENPEIPLGVKTDGQQMLTFKLDSVNNINSDIGIYLKDKINGVTQNLKLKAEYTVNPGEGDLQNRFVLLLSEKDITQDAFGSGSVDAYVQDGLLYVIIRLKDEQVNLSMHNIAGQLLLSRTLNGEGHHKLGTAPVPGVYIMTVYTGMGTVSKKILVK